MVKVRAFDGLAVLLEYPEASFLEQLPLLLNDINAFDEGLTEQLRGYLEPLAELTLHEIEELYTRTFDINPVCSQEIGWQVYGETYDRGGFLVKVNAMLAEHGIPQSKELGDHLPQMLRLFARRDDDRARELAIGFLNPGIDKMLAGFSDATNPYHCLLTCAKKAIAVTTGLTETEGTHAR